MTETTKDALEPYWLMKMRQAAKQRPRTRFKRIRWIELQYLLRERDALWNAADSATRERLLKARETDDYSYLSPQERQALQAWKDKEGTLGSP